MSTSLTVFLANMVAVLFVLFSFLFIFLGLPVICLIHSLRDQTKNSTERFVWAIASLFPVFGSLVYGLAGTKSRAIKRTVVGGFLSFFFCFAVLHLFPNEYDHSAYSSDATRPNEPVIEFLYGGKRSANQDHLDEISTAAGSAGEHHQQQQNPRNR